MLNHQDIIKALNDAISDTFTSLAFDKKKDSEKELMQQLAEKVSHLFSTKLNQLEKK